MFGDEARSPARHRALYNNPVLNRDASDYWDLTCRVTSTMVTLREYCLQSFYDDISRRTSSSLGTMGIIPLRWNAQDNDERRPFTSLGSMFNAVLRTCLFVVRIPQVSKQRRMCNPRLQVRPEGVRHPAAPEIKICRWILS